MNPWCDHMPGIGPGPERSQYLIVSVRIRNLSNLELPVKLSAANLSFDEKRLGDAADGLSLRGDDGMGSGRREFPLKAGEEKVVEFRGDGLYPEGRHGMRMFVALTLTAGAERFEIRGDGAVQVTE